MQPTKGNTHQLAAVLQEPRIQVRAQPRHVTQHREVEEYDGDARERQHHVVLQHQRGVERDDDHVQHRRGELARHQPRDLVVD